MNTHKSILPKLFDVDGKYAVQFFIKKGSHAETYRVKDRSGKTMFLKLFDLVKLHRTQFDTEGDIKEIEFLKTVSHSHIVTYRDSGECFVDNQRFAYLVLDFISGETLAERLARDKTLEAHEVKRIAKEVLAGLAYLHGLPRPIVHNDINHENIMLDMSHDVPEVRIIDFGYARFFHNSTKVYYRVGLNPHYLAPECFNNVFSPQSDLFSVGALIYHLLFGLPPWHVDVSDYRKTSDDLEDMILEARNRPLKMPSMLGSRNFGPEKEAMMPIILKALSGDVELRFRSAEEMIHALDGEIKVETPTQAKKSKPVTKKSASAGGFADIAGMADLKDMLYNDVIRALEEKELFEEYGLTIPNGLLLYGPPGCGKSFFAQKLAEEAGYNYMEVRPSDLASIYVHGSQERIGELFKEARKNAPTIINFEEFDALVPKRGGGAGAHQAGEVNEFLAQLNNCGKDGVFVIASTNHPEAIDNAVIRAGRIDKVVFLPPPDFEARKEMFRMLLEKRPLDLGIAFDKLAEMTDNYVSVDITNVVNEAARAALRERAEITMEILIRTIQQTPATVKASEIQRYEAIRESMEGKGTAPQRTPVGFKFNSK
jgi:transitional endoplasmic reticulum ATPase